MELPDSLPAQLYLLTYDAQKQRMAGRLASGHLGAGLRAAALLELLHRQQIADEGGKVVLVPAGRHQIRGGRPVPAAEGASGTGRPVADPVLTRALDQIRASRRPRTWRHWIGADNRVTTRCVRDQLEAGRWLRVDRTRILGLFPHTTVTVRDTRSVTALINEVRAALRSSTSVARLDDRSRQLAALGALVEIRILASGRDRRAHRARIVELTASIAPAGVALRKVVQSQQSADGAAGAA